MTIVDKPPEKPDLESVRCKHSSSLTPFSSRDMESSSSSWSVGPSATELSRAKTACMAPTIGVTVNGSNNTALQVEKPREQGECFSLLMMLESFYITTLKVQQSVILNCLCNICLFFFFALCSGHDQWGWHCSSSKSPVFPRAALLEVEPGPTRWSRSPKHGQHMFLELYPAVSDLHGSPCQLHADQRAYQNM